MWQANTGGVDMDAVYKRTSVRKYLEQDVEEEKLEQLLKAAMAAPSAGNQQPWEFYVVKDRGTLEQLAAGSPYAGCVKDAPAAIVSCYRKNVIMPEYAQIDMGACTENILVEAVELGLGAVWLGVAPIETRMQAVRNVLRIQEGLEPFAIISLGYPAAEPVLEERFSKSRIHYVY